MMKVSDTHLTLGLAMIMKDEITDLDRIVHDYGHLFDKIYVTVTDRNTYLSLRKKYSGVDGLVQLSYFKWIDHFGKARRYNQQQIKTDYWMWIDTDDEIEGGESIPSVIESMAAKSLDVVWFEYDYIRRDNHSDPEAISRRERIISTKSKLTWTDEAVHEYVSIRDNTRQEFMPQIVIKHRKTNEQVRASGERNRLILEKEWLRTHSPMVAYYLGVYFGELGNYAPAMEKLLFAAKHSESKMIQFAAWLNLCICYFQTGNYKAALAAADECIAIEPDHPEPWYHKFATYRAMGSHNLAMQSAEIFLGKPMPEGFTTLLNQDIAWYQYKGPLNIAHAYLTLGNVERAYKLYNDVKTVAPGYVDEVSMATGIELDAAFEQAYKNSLEQTGPKELLTYDKKPKTWSKNSIVYFCTPTSENWGPESLASGIGGSEEAVIHLTKRWVKMGYDVTVYNNCIQEGVVDGVRWIRYERFNPNDTFNILIAWRLNGFINGWTARKKIIDLHDTLLPLMHCTYEETQGTTLALKSKYHRSLFPEIPDNRTAIIPNGVELHTLQHKGNSRIRNRLVWTSSYDRGLEYLLEMWPYIKKAVPDVTLDIYYGFQVYDATQMGQSVEGRAWKQKMKELFKQEGITEHGRVGSKEVARAYKAADVWAYPTAFMEIDCITATKAMAAGAVPVTTSVGVLPERNQGILVDSDQVDVFLQELITLLKDDDRKAKIRAKLNVSDFDWDIVAKRWVDEVFGS